MSATVAVLSWVAMLNVTPPAGAGADRLTVNVAVVVPAFPSVTETSLIESPIEPGLQRFNVDAVLRGFGAPEAKSEAFWSVSVQPFAALRTAVVLEGAGVGPVPSKQVAAAPYPAKSTIDAEGQEPVRAVVALTSATFPAVALIAIVPAASGVGRSTVPPAPGASWTR